MGNERRNKSTSNKIKKNRKERKLLLKQGGTEVEFYTVLGLCEFLGKSREWFKANLRKGFIPDANFRTKQKSILRGDFTGEKMKGDRLFSKNILAPKLKEITDGINQGVAITAEQKLEIILAFDLEKKTLLNN